MPANATERWAWDKVTWASHCGNCIANCSYRLYTTDGEVVFQEQSGGMPAHHGIPDMNPLGCQKGGGWHAQLSSGDRILHPMKRVGERGSGEWERIGWDEALDTLADAVIDAIEEGGPHAVLIDEGAESGVVGGMGRSRFSSAINAVGLDGNSTVSDIHLGHWMTFGGLLGGSSADDTFRSDTILVWNANPAFTRIPYFHYLPEARYRGAEVVLIAPDYSPSAMHCDQFVPVRPGTDAALALGMCKVVLDEGLAKLDFVRSQTDLPLLVKRDGRYLRQSDISEEGRNDRFLCWRDGALSPVDPGHLDDPEAPSTVDLEATPTVTLADGSEEDLTTVFNLMRARLADYPAKEAAEICGVDAETICALARKIASGRTKLYNGLGSCKHHHGDLMERSMDLLLALTGSWGAPGTGFDTYIIALLEGEILGLLKSNAGAESAEQVIAGLDAFLDLMKASDPAMTEGRAVLEMMRQGAPAMTTTPPAFFLWYHAGYDDIWEREGWSDSPRPIGEYIREALSRGWWGGLVRPEPQVTPRVDIQAGTNTLRRTRGGARQLLEHVWPDLDMVAVVDFRWNTAALRADIVLPVAGEHERVDLHGANSHSWERVFADKALEPAGDSRSDWEIFRDLARAVTRRAAARGLDTFSNGMGGTRSYAEVYNSFTMGGEVETEERALDEVLRDSVLAGNLPAGTSVESLRKTGWVRPENLPRAMAGVCGGPLPPDGPFVAYHNHVREGVPFPTLTGRAQFYIDHPWFLEAGEQLPMHKEPPPAGGSYPLQLTGGHPRWSIHATNTTSPILLETTRGKPVITLNTDDAAARGISDDDLVRVFNDVGELEVSAKLSPAVRPGQVILYASWEQYLYRHWADVTEVEPGMVKWLHFASGYGHLGYSALQWQPIQSDRLYRVDVEPSD